MQARYQPTDLASMTADIASSLRSAIERAGLSLRIDCPTLPRPVFVDRDMWEKVILNLLSNAFKFTFVGEVAVALRAAGHRVVLMVQDSGVGIPAEELPRLFEWFHRIQGQRSRSFEGSGIGLALVQELVRLHGGTIEAESEPGRGTTFMVALPFGTAHLPADHIGGMQGAVEGTRVDAYVEKALRWLPDVDAPVWVRTWRSHECGARRPKNFWRASVIFGRLWKRARMSCIAQVRTGAVKLLPKVPPFRVQE